MGVGWRSASRFNYFLSPTWSLDSNYTFAMSDSYKIDYSQGFSNVTNGFTTNGTAYIDQAARDLAVVHGVDQQVF
jgi:hypothetical protein